MQHAANKESAIVSESARTEDISNRELVLGAGNSHVKKLRRPGVSNKFENPTTLDIFGSPDVVHDLNVRPLPFDDGEFTEIHAYEVLEHIGTQGDWRGFFEEFDEYHRILTPNGMLYASVPSLQSRWLWGDPGHTRVISAETLTFLDRKQYEKQVGSGAMTDYRDIYSGDFRLIYELDDSETYWFVLRRI